MEFLNPVFIILLAHGVITLSAGLLMYYRPPKKINHLYGYRTKRSMASQEQWDFAQVYSSKEMIKQSIIICSISLLSLLIPVDEMIGMILAFILIIAFVIILLYKTEKKLKEKFNGSKNI